MKRLVILLLFVFMIFRPIDIKADEFVEEKGSITIEYFDDINMEIPVEGSSWSLIKIADIKTIEEKFIDGHKIIPLLDIDIDSESTAEEILKFIDYELIDESNINLTGKTKDNIALDTYHKTTNEKGIAKFENLDYGIYLGIETKAARYHLLSAPFLVSIPSTQDDGITSKIDLNIMPKGILAGDLTIKKEVYGNAVSSSTSFEMELELPKGTYHYQYASGKEGYVKDKDVVNVSANDSITIYNLLAENEYSVVEKIANKDGYKTEYLNAKGKIVAKKNNEVVVINSRNIIAPVNTGVGMTLIIVLGICIISILIILAICIYKKRKDVIQSITHHL